MSRHTLLGFESSRLYNLYFIDDNTIMTAVGNTVNFVDVHSGEIVDKLHGKDGGGVGAIIPHPSKVCHPLDPVLSPT